MFINSYISLVNQDPFYEDDTKGLRDRGLPGASVELLDSQCPPVVSLPRTPLALPTEAAPENPPSQSQDVRATLSGAEVLTDRLLIDFYIDLRQTEVDSVLRPHQVKSLKARAYEIYGLQPLADMSRLQNVASFVNTVYRDRIYDIGAIFLQFKNAKLLDNRVKGGKILVENDISRQLY